MDHIDIVRPVRDDPRAPARESWAWDVPQFEPGEVLAVDDRFPEVRAQAAIAVDEQKRRGDAPGLLISASIGLMMAAAVLLRGGDTAMASVIGTLAILLALIGIRMFRQAGTRQRRDT